MRATPLVGCTSASASACGRGRQVVVAARGGPEGALRRAVGHAKLIQALGRSRPGRGVAQRVGAEAWVSEQLTQRLIPPPAELALNVVHAAPHLRLGAVLRGRAQGRRSEGRRAGPGAGPSVRAVAEKLPPPSAARVRPGARPALVPA